MATVLITGGTGLIGKALTRELVAKGYAVIILTRKLPVATKQTPAISYALWNVEKETIDKGAISKGDYIIHLAGANVAEGKWTGTRKKEIVESRTQSAALLVKALTENSNKVKAVISASAIGWYGPDPQIPNPNPFTETDPANPSFLGKTCEQWEQSIEPVTSLGIRLVKLRTGIVLSNEGGAYAEFKKPLRFGMASILGDGEQVISWIHISDMTGLYIYAMENENVNGVYNAVAPNPVSNKALILAVAKESKPFFVPVHVPGFVLKTMLGEMSVEVLKSATVSAKKTEQAGYRFIFPDIGTAVHNLQKKAS